MIYHDDVLNVTPADFNHANTSGYSTALAVPWFWG
jgi:hypothetical protein